MVKMIESAAKHYFRDVIIMIVHMQGYRVYLTIINDRDSDITLF